MNLARGAAEAVTHIIEEDLHMQHKTKAKLKQLHSQSELFFSTIDGAGVSFLHFIFGFKVN